MKIYAKQLDPELFDYRVYEDYISEEIIVDGGREFVSMHDEELISIKKAINDYNCYDFHHYYDGSIKSYLNDYLPQKDNLKKLSPKELHRIKKMIEDFEEDDDIIIACLEIIHHKPYKVTGIHGCCQGDYCKVYCPEETTQKEIDYVEAVYFGTGTEIEIHDEDNDVNDADDIQGYSYLTTEWKTEKIKEEIASLYKNAKPEDVVYYSIKNSYQVKHLVYEAE